MTPQVLQEHVGKWNGLAPATANLKKAAVRSFFSWAVDADFMQRNPARLLKAQKIIQTEAHYLNMEEVHKLRETIKDSARNNLLFSAYIMTGCRLRELLNLNVGDVRGKNVISILGKGSKVRQIFLSQYLTGLVRNVIADRSDAAPLFQSAQGNRLSASRVQTMLKGYCAVAGIKRISPHGLRHTFLTMLYGATKDVLLCQQAAGHSSIQTTQRYCHVNHGQLQKAVTRLYEKERA